MTPSVHLLVRVHVRGCVCIHSRNTDSYTTRLCVYSRITTPVPQGCIYPPLVNVTWRPSLESDGLPSDDFFPTNLAVVAPSGDWLLRGLGTGFGLWSGDSHGNVIIRKAQRRIHEDERRPGRRVPHGSPGFPTGDFGP